MMISTNRLPAAIRANLMNFSCMRRTEWECITGTSSGTPACGHGVERYGLVKRYTSGTRMFSVQVEVNDELNAVHQRVFGLMINTVPDADGDGIVDAIDNRPLIPNPDQINFDGADDGGDACDTDNDNDDLFDADDNCPKISNPNQENTNGGSRGDVCVSLPPGC
ncbi:MAG: thrombospondin type 3 repeat-containing protein [Haliea sp.]|nr:thrombospondin type 3 repeat-containing protein [Haliea sp.]